MTINIHELIWAIINFVVLLALLYKFLYGPMLKMLDQRRSEVAGNLERAEAARKEAEALLDQYRKEINQARQEAQAIVDQANALGEKTREQIVNEARSEAAAILDKARQEIEREKAEALAQLRDEVSTLAILAAGKVIGRSLRPEDHRQVVDQFVQEVGKLQ
ncbi:MAG: F0F1 ATP synthase subunit B [Clostridia bacterium]|nr:F0F1 ATP synthase subunit B [Clostridia bacterium]